MPITEALKKLIKTITGKNAVGETIEELVQNLNDNYPEGGGSGSLPTPGAAGNVLTSTGTGWESAAPSDNALVITADMDLSDFSLGNFDIVDFDDIKTAFDANKDVRLVVKINNEPSFVSRLTLANGDIAIFVTEVILGEGVSGCRYGLFIVYYDNTAIKGDGYTYEHLPVAAASNNGKILGVENGAYALVAPTLNIEGTMSGGNFTITNVTAAQINAAYMAHRPVYIDLPAMHARVYLQVCEYTDDTSYKFTFCNTQITSDGIVVIQASFNDSLTGDVDSKTAAAT